MGGLKMRVIEYEDVKVETPYKLLSVEEIKMKHQINDHAQIMIKGIIEEEEGYDATINTELENYIKIYRQIEEENTIVFKGQIARVETRGEGSLYRIEIEGISSSFMLDTKKKSRSFQNVNMTYNEIIKKVINSHKDSDFILNIEDRKIEKPIIQYEETDWEFLKRLASHFNTVLVCDISDNKPRFTFGFAKKNKKEIENTQFYRASKDLEALKMAEKDFHDTDFFYYEIESKEDYEIQDEVLFKQKRLYISKVEASYSDGIFKYRYRLSRINGIYTNKKNNDKIKGAAIEGKVIDRKEDKVKLHLKIDEEQTKKDGYWFTYEPLTNNAMYLLPEINTHARLYFPSSKEEDGQAVNSIRKNGDSCEETRNPNIRYLTTKDKNQIKMSPGEVEIKSNKALPLKLSLNDEKGIEIWSNRDIILESLKEMTIIAGGEIQLIAMDQIVLTSKNTRQNLSLENEFHMLGKRVYLEGRERRSYPPFDDAPEICEPEKKAGFNWGKLAKNIFCGLAVVAAVAAVTVLTFGTGTVAMAAVTGAAIAGSISVVGKGVSDVVRGEVSDTKDYIKDGVKESIIGGVCGAFAGAVEVLAVGKKAIDIANTTGKVAVQAVKLRMAVHTAGGVGESLIDQGLRGEGISLRALAFDGVLEGLTIGVIDGQWGRKVGKALTDTSPVWLRRGADKVCETLKDGKRKLKEGISNLTPSPKLVANGIAIDANDVFDSRRVNEVVEQTDVQKKYNMVMAEAQGGSKVGKSVEGTSKYDSITKLKPKKYVVKQIHNAEGSILYTLKTKAGREFDILYDVDGFPVFDEVYHMTLKPEDFLKSRDTHFSRAGKDLYEKIQKDSNLKKLFTEAEIEDFRWGDVPEKWTWHHNQEDGLMQLVLTEEHKVASHTGGFSIWGPGNK